MANGGESAASKIFVGIVVTVGGGLVLALLVSLLGLNGGGGGGGGRSSAPTLEPTPTATHVMPSATNPPATPSRPATVPPSGCVLTITFSFAEMNEEPRHDAPRVGDVPEGEYPSSNSTIANWGGRDERWFEITVDSRTGWIVDDGIQIESKSADCP